MTTRTVSGGQYLAEMFEGYGATHVFYVEASFRETNIELEKRGVKRVSTHSEKAAAYMADGYARAGKKPGVCFCQSVGAANLAAGLQDAFLANSPVIAITGKKPATHSYRNSYQEIDHWPLYEPVTKYNVSTDKISEIPRLLRQAYREAVTGCPGPVHIDLCNHLGNIDAETGELDFIVEERFTKTPPFRFKPLDEEIETASGLLNTAKRPVIVAGRGVIASGAERAVIQIAEKIKMPVATTPDGKATIPENHPLSVGVVGDYSIACANQIVYEADLVLYIGSHTGDQVTLDWTIPQKGTDVIQIDIDPVELGKNYPNRVSLLGDARLTVEELIRGVTEKPSSGWDQHAAVVVEHWRDSVYAFCNSDDLPIRPERLCSDLSAILPKDAILVADTGYSAIWSAAITKLNSPEQQFLRAAGGSLGWSFPASLGVKCACPDKPVVCFTGDGALWYHIAELETQARHDIKTVTVVNNNQGFAQCRNSVLASYNDRPGNPEELYTFKKDVNLANIAKEIGIYSMRVEKPGDIIPVIQEALESGKPALVEVVTDITATPLPVWRPGDSSLDEGTVEGDVWDVSVRN